MTKSYFDAIIMLIITIVSLTLCKGGISMKETYFSYSRISTDEDHQKFNRQEKALAKYAEDHKIKYFREFKDEKTGATFDRPEFKELDSHLQKGDTVVMKDLSRFTREAENGYAKYMEWLSRGVNIVFIDNPTISSDYIHQLTKTAESQDLVSKTAMECFIKLLLIVELDRAEKQRKYISKAIKDGISASAKKQGRKEGSLDKMTDSLKNDIEIYLEDRTVLQVDLMKKHDISRNTLKKYAEYIKELNKKEK